MLWLFNNEVKQKYNFLNKTTFGLQFKLQSHNKASFCKQHICCAFQRMKIQIKKRTRVKV